MNKCCTVIWLQRLCRKDPPNCDFSLQNVQASLRTRVQNSHLDCLHIIVGKQATFSVLGLFFSWVLDREKPGANEAYSVLLKCRISKLLFSSISELPSRTGLYFCLVLWKASSWVSLLLNFNSCRSFEGLSMKKGLYQLMWNLAALWHRKLCLKWFLAQMFGWKSLVSNTLLKCSYHGLQLHFSGVASEPCSVCISLQQHSLQSPKLIDNSLLSLWHIYVINTSFCYSGGDLNISLTAIPGKGIQMCPYPWIPQYQ